MPYAEAAANATDTQTKVSCNVTPIEPRFSILTEAPVSILQAMLVDLDDFADDSALDDTYQSIGITRREMFDQVKLVLICVAVSS